MSREGDRDTTASPVDHGAGRGRLATVAALACVPLLLLAMSPQLLRGTNIVEQGDVYKVYYPGALKVRAGLVPYRHFPLEYPLLSLPVVLLPAAFGSNRLVYEAAFVVEMLLINAALIWVVAWEVERSAGRARLVSRLVWYCLLFAVLSRMIISRLDLAPTLLAFWSATLWYRGKTGTAGVLAGLGALMKIFPGFVVFPGVLWEASRAGGRRFRGLIAFVLVMTTGMGAWLAVGGRGAIASLTYHGERGLEIGSLYAGILMGIGKVTGWHYSVPFDHGSFNLEGPWAGGLARLSGFIQLTMLGLTLGQFAGTGFRSGIRFTLAVLTATIMTAKLLSPQYFIWLLPFVVSLDGPVGRRARPLYAVICVVTLVIYPTVFDPLTRLSPGAVVLLNVRNLLGLVFWGLVTFAGDPARTASEADFSS